MQSYKSTSLGSNNVPATFRTLYQARFLPTSSSLSTQQHITQSPLERVLQFQKKIAGNHNSKAAHTLAGRTIQYDIGVNGDGTAVLDLTNSSGANHISYSPYPCHYQFGGLAAPLNYQTHRAATSHNAHRNRFQTSNRITHMVPKAPNKSPKSQLSFRHSSQSNTIDVQIRQAKASSLLNQTHHETNSHTKSHNNSSTLVTAETNLKLIRDKNYTNSKNSNLIFPERSNTVDNPKCTSNNSNNNNNDTQNIRAASSSLQHRKYQKQGLWQKYYLAAVHLTGGQLLTQKHKASKNDLTKSLKSSQSPSNQIHNLPNESSNHNSPKQQQVVSPKKPVILSRRVIIGGQNLEEAAQQYRRQYHAMANQEWTSNQDKNVRRQVALNRNKLSREAIIHEPGMDEITATHNVVTEQPMQERLKQLAQYGQESTQFPTNRHIQATKHRIQYQNIHLSISQQLTSRAIKSVRSRSRKSHMIPVVGSNKQGQGRTAKVKDGQTRGHNSRTDELMHPDAWEFINDLM